MVQLSLSTAKGNAGSRAFPFQGYLGLTPVRVDGVVRTRFDEDQKPILAKSISVSVRAYESRQARTGSHHSRLLVDYTQTLWRKPDDVPYTELGEFEQPFRITLPKRVAGFSTANYQDYRTYWRLEAVLEHAPQPSVGSRILKHCELMLIRGDIPPNLPMPSPPSIASLYLPAPSPTSTSLPALSHATNKPRAPVLNYNLSTPTFPIGPSDLLFTSLFIRPLDPSVSIRSASLLVERRIDLHEVDASSTALILPAASCAPSPPTNAFTGNHVPPLLTASTSLPESDNGRRDMSAGDIASRSTSTLESTASTNTITSRTPLLSSQPSSSSHSTVTAAAINAADAVHPHKSITTTVAAAEGTSFTLDKDTGVWSKTISLQWPAARSHAKWSMGETMRGSLGAVSFWVKVKVIVTSPTGTETIELVPREICIVLINDAERRHAQAQFAEARLTSSSKSPARPATEGNPSSSPVGPILDSSASALPHRQAFSSPISSAYALSDTVFPYTPPKSAGASTSSPPVSLSSVASSHIIPSSNAPTGANGKSPSSSNSVSATFSRVLPSKKKPRRPHTSAGPRDSVDVRVGGAVPVPVPIPVPQTPYSNPSSTSSSPDSHGQRNHRSSSSGGQNSLTDREHDRDRDSPTPPSKSPVRLPPAFPFDGGQSFKTLNESFTGMNGIGGPGAMALVWNQHQQRLSAEELIREEQREQSLERERAREQERHRQRQRERDRDSERDTKSSELVRAWEEELARIEKASKRGSRDMLGFWSSIGRRKSKANV